MKNLLLVLLFLGALIHVKAQTICVDYSDVITLGYDMEVCIIFSSHCNCPEDPPVALMDCVTLSEGESHCFPIPTFPCSGGVGEVGPGGGDVLGCAYEVRITPSVGESVSFFYEIGESGMEFIQGDHVYFYEVNPDGSISIHLDVIVGG